MNLGGEMDGKVIKIYCTTFLKKWFTNKTGIKTKFNPLPQYFKLNPGSHSWESSTLPLSYTLAKFSF